MQSVSCRPSLKLTFFMMLRWGHLTTCMVFVFMCAGIMNAAEYKIDVTIFDDSPLVGENTSEGYRVYLPSNRRNATFTQIGRSISTGTGEIGQGYLNPGDGDILTDVSGLPGGSSISIAEQSTWRRLKVTFPRSDDVRRIGVFYAVEEKDSESVRIPIIKMSQTATITPDQYTKTIGVGEYVTLSVNSTVDKLRWVHNNGEIIAAWNDLTEVTIDNVRLADAGIYECFEDGKREMGQHAIMRLIVRGCPSPKYGADCSNNCTTCWNGGVCAADNGVCLCQPGFAGEQCEQRLDNNHWGANGSLYCNILGLGMKNCFGALVCGPDPIGCSCVAGFTGLNCKTECPSGFYGSNCMRQCHCDMGLCNTSIGCELGMCFPGYRGNNCQCFSGYSRNSNCQGVDSCSKGNFGVQCEFVCHCHDEDGCDKQTGVCDNDKCAYGWGGSDCQQALPYFHDDRQITTHAIHNSTTVEISWSKWSPEIDHGTGHVHQYKVYYWKFDSTMSSVQFVATANTSMLITHLLPETMYNFAIAVVQTYELLEGPRHLNTSQITRCDVPSGAPQNIAHESPKEGQLLLTWDLPRCGQLHGRIITYECEYWLETTDVIERINTTTNKKLLTDLLVNATYRFRVRAYTGEGAGPFSATIEAFATGPESGEILTKAYTSTVGLDHSHPEETTPGELGFSTIHEDIDDECASEPCKNQGACEDGLNEYECSCALWYTGTTCESLHIKIIAIIGGSGVVFIIIAILVVAIIIRRSRRKNYEMPPTSVTFEKNTVDQNQYMSKVEIGPLQLTQSTQIHMVSQDEVEPEYEDPNIIQGKDEEDPDYLSLEEDPAKIKDPEESAYLALDEDSEGADDADYLELDEDPKGPPSNDTQATQHDQASDETTLKGRQVLQLPNQSEDTDRAKCAATKIRYDSKNEEAVSIPDDDDDDDDSDADYEDVANTTEQDAVYGNAAVLKQWKQHAKLPRK